MSPAAALAITTAVMAAVGLVGWSAGRRGVADRDAYLSARNTQGAWPLALSFFSSGLGAWILFSPPEVGATIDIAAVVGYGVAAGLPFIALAWLGPLVRAAAPEGVTLSDWVALRFGRPMQAYVAVVSVFYMFIFLTAELTALGGVVGLLTGAAPGSALWLAPIALVALVTTAYTAYGGLPTSLRTDRFQAWLILGFVPLALIGIAGGVDDPAAALRASGGLTPTADGWRALVVLGIAVAAANLFHQGYWQRSWSAVDRRTLVRGAVGGALLTLPVLVLVGLTGMLAKGAGTIPDSASNSIAFFTLLTAAPTWLAALVVALAVALVGSGVDTLENSLAATFSSGVAGGRMTLRQARWLTVALTLPAVGLALANLSVLQLFLAADLLAAATVVPVFLGLSPRIDRRAALAGAVAGLVGVVALGVVRDGGVAAGLRLLVVQTGPAGLDLGAFVVAPVVAGVVTVVGSWVGSYAPGQRQPRR